MSKTKMTFDISADATVAAERKKLVELQTKLTEAGRQLQRANDDSGKPRKTAREIAVDRELGRETSAIEPRLNYTDARERVRILEAAVAEQAKVVDAAELTASAAIATDTLPQYTAIVKRMAKAFAEAKAAAGAERELRLAMQEAGIRYGTVIHTVPFPENTFNGWFNEAREHYSIAV